MISRKVVKEVVAEIEDWRAGESLDPVDQQDIYALLERLCSVKGSKSFHDSMVNIAHEYKMKWMINNGVDT